MTTCTEYYKYHSGCCVACLCNCYLCGVFDVIYFIVALIPGMHSGRGHQNQFFFFFGGFCVSGGTL